MCIGALFVLHLPDGTLDDARGPGPMDEATLRLLEARSFIEIELNWPEVHAITHDAGRVLPAVPAPDVRPSRALDHTG